MINEKYLFEVGGIAVDDTETGSGNRIPLWMFGMMYQLP